MLLSESEKNRIKGLYGLISEAIPPDESVLVEKKNPFKYNNYQTARRFYNSNLKNDELFFVFDRELLERYIKSKFIENFDKKTIRYNIKGYPQEDKIVTFDLSNRMLVILKFEKGTTGTQCIHRVDLPILDRNAYITFDPAQGIKTLTWREIKSTSHTIPETTQIIEVQSNETIINKVFSFSNWNTIPDEYFEIRKVQRKQTDF